MVFGQHFYGNFINLTCQSKASVFKTPQENYPKEVKSKPRKGHSLATTSMPYKEKPAECADMTIEPYKLTTYCKHFFEHSAKSY